MLRYQLCVKCDILDYATKQRNILPCRPQKSFRPQSAVPAFQRFQIAWSGQRDQRQVYWYYRTLIMSTSPGRANYIAGAPKKLNEHLLNTGAISQKLIGDFYLCIKSHLYLLKGQGSPLTPP